jgi:hypothetical protein
MFSVLVCIFDLLNIFLWSVYHRTLLIEFPIKIAYHISLIEPCYSFHYLILITNIILLNISLITMLLFHLCFRLIACIVMPTDKNCCMQNLWEPCFKRERCGMRKLCHLSPICCPFGTCHVRTYSLRLIHWLMDTSFSPHKSHKYNCHAHSELQSGEWQFIMSNACSHFLKKLFN